jgi:hypothetical protein
LLVTLANCEMARSVSVHDRCKKGFSACGSKASAMAQLRASARAQDECRSQPPDGNAAQNRKAVLKSLKNAGGFGRSRLSRTRLMIRRWMVSCSHWVNLTVGVRRSWIA